MDGLMVGWMYVWMDGWVGVWMDGWMDGWMGGWLVGSMDGWIDGWLDGWKVIWQCDFIPYHFTLNLTKWLTVCLKMSLKLISQSQFLFFILRRLASIELSVILLQYLYWQSLNHILEWNVWLTGEWAVLHCWLRHLYYKYEVVKCISTISNCCLSYKITKHLVVVIR